MAKKNITFFCKECGYETSGWMGQCPGCKAWNTLVESSSVTGSTKSKTSDKLASSPTYQAATYSWTQAKGTVRLKDAGKEDYIRVSTGINELDTLLGGGLTSGSVTLVGGEPGIGKSTILLQMANSYQGSGDILYVSGEESPAQIGMRAERLGITNDRIIICAQTSFEVIAEELSSIKPCLCIIDSIQTLYSDSVSGTPGSVTQAKEVTAGLIRIAKSNNLPIVLVGHVTKEGSIAGPKTLEHMVDTVLYFEGDNTGSYRILRSVKNRFGRSSELAFFEMQSAGLKAIDSASALLIAGRPLEAPGSALTSTMEGARALTIEIQALITDACYGTPQRMTYGPDKNRVSMLIALCEKIFRLSMPTKDCFLNVIGGLKVTDPACDLGIIAAIISSAKGIPVKPGSLLIGEVGLSGELRPVSQINQRIADCKRLGIKTIVLPSSCRTALETNDAKSASTSDKMSSYELVFVDNLAEAIDVIFA